MFHAKCVFLGLGIKNINKTLDCPLIFFVSDVFVNEFARATSSPDKNFFIKTAFIFLYFRLSAIDIICINAMRIFGCYLQANIAKVNYKFVIFVK